MKGKGANAMKFMHTFCQVVKCAADVGAQGVSIDFQRGFVLIFR